MLYGVLLLTVTYRQLVLEFNVPRSVQGHTSGLWSQMSDTSVYQKQIFIYHFISVFAGMAVWLSLCLRGNHRLGACTWNY